MTGAGEPLLRHRLVVRFSDCDPLGHVNNAVYLTYIEQARIILWRKQIGLKWSQRAAQGLPRGEGFILARAEVDFRAQAHEGDELVAHAHERSASGRTGVYDIEVTNQRGDKIALFRGKSYRIKGHVVEEA